jgi:dipeptidase D
MSEAVRNLSPKTLWNHFADLNAVPRPSKKEERVIGFMVDFAKKLNLKYTVDQVGNVIIQKPATKNLENRKKVILQSHLDMVHQKNNDTIFDFETQGIAMYIDGDWVTAKGTTLGADNGLGVASIMAILSSNDIEHPAIEALFTIDEETGMTGAMGLQPNILEGEILLNLDTEEDDEIGVGCAGGIDITATKEYKEEETPKDSKGFVIEVKGLQGGHSGMDIHKGLANANKLMNRILYTTSKKYNIRISSILGGSLRNAIPRESKAIITVKEDVLESFQNTVQEVINNIKTEFLTLEPNISIEISPIETPKKVVSLLFQAKLLQAIYATINGVYRMSPDITDLVETSNNIAKVTVKNGLSSIECLTRSSSESGKTDLSNTIQAVFQLADFQVNFSGEYPGWQPNLQSETVKIMTCIYTDLFKEAPKVAACHAGLECGILGKNYPKIDMVSFGPTIKGAHSPDERVSISSTQKFWKFLVEILKNIPEKG